MNIWRRPLSLTWFLSYGGGDNATRNDAGTVAVAVNGRSYRHFDWQDAGSYRSRNSIADD